MTALTSTPAVTPGTQLTFAHGPSWANRFALAPLTNTQSHADGTLSDDEYRWLEARGRGGMGLTMTCAAFVSPAGQAWPGQLGVASDDHLPGLTRLADGLRATGTTSSVQLHHGGRRADPALSGRPNQCPWDDPKTNSVAMTTEEIQDSVADFVAAAVRAEEAGFDGAEIHGAHGYLACQFLDARNNHRTDQYGGSATNRMRFLVEVVDGIRAATGPDFQLGLRLTPEGSGMTLADGVEVAATMLAAQTLDYIDMSLWDVFMHPRGETGDDDRLLIEHFTSLERGETRLGVAGKVLSASDAAWCLEKGADFVSVGIGAILHHDFASSAVADAGFVAMSRPVTREHLVAECVSPTFIDYLSGGWDDLIE
ncbi:NADH:flavin oxidoreductase [Nocardioides sp.]|uniref:NADH:flavin oxidoreductase n=1 Tax=Nocardioides sp. TaxID=35761 RepID=UPI002B277674|nr:NADH:flavin oxidoreductase [Nocardioides sp.]